MFRNIVFCIVIFASVSAHAENYNTYFNQVSRLLQAFCIDPVSGSVEDLYSGIDGCFIDHPDYQCIKEATSVAWYDQKTKKDFSSIPYSQSNFNKHFEKTKAHCNGKEVYYRDIVSDCIEIAKNNQIVLQAYYLFKKGCVNYKDLDSMVQELSHFETNPTMMDVADVMRQQFLSRVAQYELVKQKIQIANK